MRAPSRKSLVRLLLPVAAVTLLLAVTGSAQAATVVKFGPDTESVTLSVTDDCRGGLPGTLTGTSVITGQFVDTFPPTPGFYFHSTEVDTFRVDFVDGSYALGSFTNHSSGGGPIIPSGANPFENTSTVLAKVTVYDANGQELGTETVHMLFHLTAFVTSTGDFIVRVSLDQAHSTCAF